MSEQDIASMQEYTAGLERNLAKAIDGLIQAANNAHERHIIIAPLQRDADRFRWLRDVGITEEGTDLLEKAYPCHEQPTPQRFEAAIDQATEWWKERS